MLYMVRLVYRPALVLPEELHVAISVPCSDKFTVPQHAHRHYFSVVLVCFFSIVCLLPIL